MQSKDAANVTSGNFQCWCLCLQQFKVNACLYSQGFLQFDLDFYGLHGKLWTGM